MGFEALTVATEVGMRAYDYVRGRGAPLNNEQFIGAYADNLAAAIDLQSAIAGLTKEETQTGAQGIMRSLAAVVKAYHRREVRINVNYFVPEAPTADLVSRAKFCRKDRRPESFACFLVLKAWATESGAAVQGLTLPVEPADGANDPVLFGAPKCYRFNEPYLVQDTDEIWSDVAEHESEAIRREVGEYFRAHRSEFRSFVSLPVEPPPTGPDRKPHTCKDPVMAVVNIQSSRPKLLGWEKGNQVKLRLVLTPFLRLLAYYLVKLHYDARSVQEQANGPLS